MKSYPSIETVFVRDKATNRLEFGKIRMPEVHCVREWTLSEKVDGTNVRVIVTLEGISIRGRTDNATLHPDLVRHVESLFDHTKTVEFFTKFRGKELPEQWSVTFYGEGYGAGIQKAGKGYSDTKRFRCFDLMLGEFWWTSDSQMRDVCAELAIPTVPHLGCIHTPLYVPDTLENLLELFPTSGSIVAVEDSNRHGVMPEGVVAKPLIPLLNVHGERVMWKLTCREFEGAQTCQQ